MSLQKGYIVSDNLTDTFPRLASKFQTCSRDACYRGFE